MSKNTGRNKTINMCTIWRSNPKTERAVGVNFRAVKAKHLPDYPSFKSKHWTHFNPACQVQKVIGSHLGRDRCVVGFADGLSATGWTVRFVRKDEDERVKVIRYHPIPHISRPEYFLTGVLFSLNVWGFFSRILTSEFPAQDRQIIFQTTAEYCLSGYLDGNYRPISKVFLVIPKGRAGSNLVCEVRPLDWSCLKL